MDLEKSKRIIAWIVFLPVLGVILTTVLLVGIYIKYENAEYLKESLKIQNKFLKDSKIRAKERVESIVTFLSSNEKILHSEARQEVKNIVFLAREIIQNVYYTNKNLPKSIIIQQIKDKLRNIRFFDDLSGYFFIYDLKGKSILLPTIPTFEDSSLYNYKNAKGKYVIQDIIKIAKNDLEGFYSWDWYKPNEKVLKKKIGYVSLYAPLGIVVGTAKYEENILSKVKKEAQEFLKNTRYDDGSYFFMYNSKGELLSEEKERNLFDNNLTVIKSVIKGAKESPDGFFISQAIRMKGDFSKSLQHSSVFVRYIKDLDWVVGINTYSQNLDSILMQKKKELEDDLHKNIQNIISISTLIVIVILLLMLEISKRLKRILRYYNNKLLIKHKKTLEQKKLLQHQIQHDTLTSLPNRTLLEDRLRQLLKRANREKYKIAVLFLDVDKFKFINDTYGHHIGDILLKKVARRLKRTVRNSDIVARLSGDEFIVVLDDCKDIHSILSVLNKFQDNFSKDFILENITQKMNLSIGVSIYPDDGQNVSELLRNADTAMLKVKEEGRGNYKFYTNEMNSEVEHELQVERELQEAIKNKEFELYYQPIVGAKNFRIEGLEALIRWNHPTRGFTYPDYFIEIAEDSNLIIQIGEWVTKEAMKQVSRWYEMGLRPGRVSINFASRQLAKDNLYDFIVEALEETNCRPEWIGIEVVERVIMRNPERSIQLLKQLRDINVGISIDDFGTGSSSLSYLKELPITKLKIDKAFINNLENSFEDRAIAKTILALGRGLYLKVLAEGVETQAQKEFLVRNGCTQMQGYLFSRPLNAKGVTELLQKQEALLE